MAAKSTRTQALTWTLGAGVADTFDWGDNATGGGTFGSTGINVAQAKPPFTLMVNMDPTNTVWVRFDGTAAVAEAEGTILVPPNFGTAKIANRGAQLSVVSAGAAKVSAIRMVV